MKRRTQPDAPTLQTIAAVMTATMALLRKVSGTNTPLSVRVNTEM